MSLLGNRLIATGDIRRYEIDYADFLQHGDVILNTTVTDNGPTSAVTTSSLDVTQTKVFFFLRGGVVGEAFAVTATIVTQLGETVHDTIAYQVVAA